jgi:hypothetical protein
VEGQDTNKEPNMSQSHPDIIEDISLRANIAILRSMGINTIPVTRDIHESTEEIIHEEEPINPLLVIDMQNDFLSKEIYDFEKDGRED